MQRPRQSPQTRPVAQGVVVGCAQSAPESTAPPEPERGSRTPRVAFCCSCRRGADCTVSCYPLHVHVSLTRERETSAEGSQCNG